MGSDVTHVHRPEPEVLAPVAEIAAPQPVTAFPSPVLGVSRVAAAGAELLEALEPEPATPTGGVLVGKANDPAEHEADRVATQVVAALRQGSAPGPALLPETNAEGGLRRKGPGGGDPLGGTTVGGGVAEVLQRRRGGGAPLTGDVASAMGGAFGADFGAVRIHTDGQADEVARSLQATAFTQGNDIYFSSGTYDPGSAAGQHLLAHELTHVVQNGGAEVQRKMWTAAAFKKATSEGALVGASDAQDQISSVLTEYAALYAKRGVIAPENKAKATARIAELKKMANWWIQHQPVDEEGAAKKPKRLAGFERFLTHLAEEEADLEHLAAPVGGAPLAVEAPSKGFLKLQGKYEGNPKTFFAKMGDLAQQAVEDDGDETELWAEISFPVDPSGIGYLGGRFSATVSKDDGMIKMRSELAITGGANVAFAKIGGEVGGYFDTQATTGADCMELVSYALYRRFKESNAVPSEMSSYLWGRDTGSKGKEKAENWSLALEEAMFALEALPEEATFQALYPKDAAKAKSAYDTELARVTTKNKQVEDTYVQTGGIAAVGASADLGVVSAEASVAGSNGQLVDFASLVARKGGAGKANKLGTGTGNQIAGALSAGRGAQASVSRSVRSLTVAGGVSVNLGACSLAGDATLAMRWTTSGEAAAKHLLDQASLEVSGTVEVPLSEVAGGAMDATVESLQAAIEKFITKYAQPKAEKDKAALKTPDAEEPQFGALDGMLALNSDAMGVTEFKSDLAEKLSANVADLTGITSESADTYKLAISLDMIAKEVSVELRKQGSAKLDIPVGLSLGKSSSSRLCRAKYKGGWAWS